MDARFEGCTLAIIAGGRGTRLGGVVKARLRDASGRTILDRTLELIAPLVDDVMVVSNDASPFPRVRVVPDVIADRGAPGGVHAACHAARTEWVLSLASDLPFVSLDPLRRLWRAREGVDVVVASLAAGRLEPLHAFYRASSCASAFEPLLRAGEPGFARLFEAVRVRRVSADELGIDLRSFENVNTPDELAVSGLMLPDER